MVLQYRVNVPASEEERKKYPSNYISTTKYNLFTFLPLSLLFQFARYANIYFLACAILQSIPLISPLSPYSAILPLIFVLGLSMAREGFEDYKRWKSDKENNSNTTYIYHQSSWNIEKWENIKPGDFIKVHEDQLIPVDFIPLYCSNPAGISYVETASLDGEKNLKPKISLVHTQLLYNQTQTHPLMKAQISGEEPNADVNRFEGEISLQLGDKKVKEDLNHKNLLLRATKLKNTEWTIGVTLYTGSNTKVMKNGAGTTNKVSNIERKVNFIILFILLFQIICCGCSSLYCYLACLQYQAFENLLLQTESDCSQIAGIAFGSYFILYSTYIPISLIVSLEFVKVFQGYAMQTDKEMYSAVTDRKMECHTVSINQQLGQIEYILTDKTGTLTCNKMQFKNVIVGNQIYGDDIKLTEISNQFDFSRLSRKYTKLDPLPSDFFDSRGIDYELSGGSEKQEKQQTNQKKQIELMFFMITTCHECLRESKDDSFHGPSPDEVALLKAANKVGFQFIKTENKVTTVRYDKKQFQFEILKVIEFDSVRKRMTVVVKRQDEVLVFVKGADTSISALLGPNQKYLRFVEEKTREMARTGLRSLWFAYKHLPYNAVIDEMGVEEIEQKLNLLGATGIEDRLQDFVPETIFSLRQGGIKFVMLTGDKLETAQNIAKSCKMIEKGFLIDGPHKLQQGIKFINDARILQHESICPVIDGSTLSFQSNHEHILQILQISESAVFCRVTPAQKAEIVAIVKELGKLTLAIGDGANDVNMILEAHVGVGIFGEEGTRAAQVSNYAIGEFCLIWKLLLYYGRLNYMRISEMILYFFYKNMVFTIVQFAYSFYNLGSGQSFWLSWSITFFNMVFTFFPVVLRAVFEVDVQIEANKQTLRELSEGGAHVDSTLYSYYPKMYIVSQKNQLFTNLIFFEWFFLGILQGVICLMITLYSLGGLDDSSGYESYQSGFYFCELSAYTSVIIVVTLKLAINVKNWNCLLFLSFLIPSLGAYVLYCFLSNYINISVVQFYFTDILTMPTFYVANILAILGMFSMDLLLFSVEATKSNFQNYFKYKALSGKRMTEANLQHLMIQLQTAKVK